MRRSAFALSPLLFLVALIACSSTSQQSPTTPTSDAQPVTIVTTACDDGTGNTDCCSPAPVPGAACTAASDTCWTSCSFTSPDSATDGERSEYSCSGGIWVAGHGLFPCTLAAVDAGQ